MATIQATVDTEKDELVVTVDGKKIKDVTDASFYIYTPYDAKDDESCCMVSIGTKTTDDASGLTSRTYISKAGVTKSPPDTFSKPQVNKAIADIQENFKKRYHI